jgi:hypothetical protein
MPEWYVIFDATAHKNPEGEPAGVHLCTSEKEALGFAVGKLHRGHAVDEIGERVALQESRYRRNRSGIGKSSRASASDLGIAMARWIECTHQNC